MAVVTVKFQFTLTLPGTMTLTEALRLITDNLGYTTGTETRKQFLSRNIGGQLLDKIKSQIKKEAVAVTNATLEASEQASIASVDV